MSETKSFQTLVAAQELLFKQLNTQTYWADKKVATQESNQRRREDMWGGSGFRHIRTLYNPSLANGESRGNSGLFSFVSYCILVLLTRVHEGLSSPMRLYRGLSLEKRPETKDALDEQLQERHSCLCIATSVGEERARHFARNNGGATTAVYLRFHLPPGYPFLVMNDFFKGHTLYEEEVLLTPDSRWFVDNMQTEQDGTIVADLKHPGVVSSETRFFPEQTWELQKRIDELNVWLEEWHMEKYGGVYGSKHSDKSLHILFHLYKEFMSSGRDLSRLELRNFLKPQEPSPLVLYFEKSVQMTLTQKEDMHSSCSSFQECKTDKHVPGAIRTYCATIREKTLQEGVEDTSPSSSSFSFMQKREQRLLYFANWEGWITFYSTCSSFETFQKDWSIQALVIPEECKVMVYEF